MLAALGKPQSLKTIVPDRPGHDRRYALDFTKIQRELGWQPTVEFESGLAETVQWYAGNRDWWEPLLDRAPVREEQAWSELQRSRQAPPPLAGWKEFRGILHSHSHLSHDSEMPFVQILDALKQNDFHGSSLPYLTI